jgi:amino acid permease
MKILKIIYLSLSMALAIIAVHRISIEGFANNYWILMLSILFFFLYMLRYAKDKLEEQNSTKKPKK